MAGLILAGTTWAQPVPDSPADDHELQIGLAGVTSTSVYLGGNNQSRVFPAIDYTYKQFYFQAGDLGLNLVNKDNWKIDFGLGVNLAGDVDRGDSRLLSALPELSFPVNAFVSAEYKTKIGLFKIKYHHEINNKHNGHSTGLSYSAPIRRGSWLVVPQLTYENHSEEVVNYFVGIAPEDMTTNLPSYEAGSVNNWQLSLLGLRPINNKWSLIGNIQNVFYGDEITNSPMIDDDQRLSVFIGFLYKVF